MGDSPGTAAAEGRYVTLFHGQKAGKTGESLMRLTDEEVRHVAALARVAMTDDEVELMRSQLSNILEHVSVLNEVNTEGVEPTGHSVDVTSVMRDDEVAESARLEDVLANAPSRHDEFIRVKAVLE